MATAQIFIWIWMIIEVLIVCTLTLYMLAHYSHPSDTAFG